MRAGTGEELSLIGGVACNNSSCAALHSISRLTMSAIGAERSHTRAEGWCDGEDASQPWGREGGNAFGTKVNGAVVS